MGKVIEELVQRMAVLDVINDGLHRHAGSGKDGRAAQYVFRALNQLVFGHAGCSQSILAAVSRPRACTIFDAPRAIPSQSDAHLRLWQRPFFHVINGFKKFYRFLHIESLAFVAQLQEALKV